MRAIGLSDQQLAELRLTAGSLPVELREDLLRLFAGFVELEGGEVTDGSFHRALAFALDTLPARA